MAVRRILHGKKERGSNIIFPLIFRLLERISSEEKGAEIFGRKPRFKKNRGGEEYQVVANLYTPV